MKKQIIMFAMVTIAVSGLIYGATSKSTNRDNEKIMTYEKTKQSPSKFPLTVEESCMGLDNKTHGVIKNNSTDASYNYAVVRVTYFKQNSYKATSFNDIKSDLVYKEQILNEVFPPHSEVSVEFEIKAYEDLIPKGWEIINATVN